MPPYRANSVMHLAVLIDKCHLSRAVADRAFAVLRVCGRERAERFVLRQWRWNKFKRGDKKVKVWDE